MFLQLQDKLVHLSDTSIIWYVSIPDVGICVFLFLISLGLYKTNKVLPKGVANQRKMFTFMLCILLVLVGAVSLIRATLFWYDLWEVAIIIKWTCLLTSIVTASYLWFFAKKQIEDSAKLMGELAESETNEQIIEIVDRFRCSVGK